MSRLKRPVLRYHGGKWILAPWIISHFPAHRVYVEPFGGGASVLLRKERAYAEVYNDISGEIVNVFRVLQNRVQALELARLVFVTPFSRAEFDLSYEPVDDPVERSRRTIIRSFMGFGSASVNINHRTGYRSKAFRQGYPPPIDWLNYPKHVRLFAERLRGVNIENRDAFEIIPHLDSPEALFYIDPPYHHSTRSVDVHKNHCYQRELSNDDHDRLADLLLNMKGMVVLSGYDCDLYKDRFSDWRRVERKAFADGARERTEVLWLSPNVDVDMPLFNKEPVSPCK